MSSAHDDLLRRADIHLEFVSTIYNKEHLALIRDLRDALVKSEADRHNCIRIINRIRRVVWTGTIEDVRRVMEDWVMWKGDDAKRKAFLDNPELELVDIEDAASAPDTRTLAQDALDKVLAYCRKPNYFDDGRYAFPYLSPDTVTAIIRGQASLADRGSNESALRAKIERVRAVRDKWEYTKFGIDATDIVRDLDAAMCDKPHDDPIYVCHACGFNPQAEAARTTEETP